jgi:hypothetical protein
VTVPAAANAADLTKNIREELSIGGVIGCDPIDTVENIRRLKKMASVEDFMLVPGHDPVVWPALTTELAANHGLLRRRST